MRPATTALTTIVGLVGLAVSSAHAHGIWFAQHGSQLALVYGVGADDLDFTKRIGTISGVVAYDVDYRQVKAQTRIAGPVVFVDADEQPTLVAAVMDNGIWSQMAGGEFEKKTLEEMPKAAISERAMKYGVTVQSALQGEIPPLQGQTVQVVPVGKLPETLGTPMTYRVLFQGKPVAGALVINDFVNDPDALPVKSGADGIVKLPVRNQGLNVVRATYYGPSDQPKKYTRIEHIATLAFTLQHAPD